MHRYDELEKLYYKNKIKKYMLICAAAVFVCALAYWLPGLVFNKKNQNIKKIDIDFKKMTSENINASVRQYKKTEMKNAAVKTDEETVHQNKIEKTAEKDNLENNVSSKKILKNADKNTKVSLTPNLSFVVPKIQSEEIKKVTPVSVNKPATVNREKNYSGTETVKVQVIPQIKEQTINVNDLIKSFNQDPSYDTAMAVSNYYFNNNDFDNAKIWALKANNIDPSRYQSWKMFALILLKKNDKIKAKEVLKIYLDDYGNNDEIYKLLRSIDE